MAISRYDNTPIIDSRFFATQHNYKNIIDAIDNLSIKMIEYVTNSSDRLDTLATRFYDDGRYWWIIAIANDIGWSMQIPAGTLLQIPVNVDDVIERI